jgi:hypothetical protein
MTDMLDRITDSGDDWYMGINGPVRICGQTGEVLEMQDYEDPMGDYWPIEDDDRRRWEQEMEEKDRLFDEEMKGRDWNYVPPKFEPVDTRELMFKHLDALKKMYGGK